MILIIARHEFLTQSHEQFAAIVREHIDRVEGFVDNPNTFFGIVGANAHAVRPRAVRIGAEEIPLIPQLNYFTFAVEYVQAVLPSATLCFEQHVNPHVASKTQEVFLDWVRQHRFTALGNDDAIGRLGPDARIASKGEAGFSERLVPKRFDSVGTWSYRASSIALRCGLRRGKGCAKQTRGEARNQ